MSLLQPGMQITAGAALINLSAKFSDSGSQPSGTALNGVNPAAGRPLGGEGGDAGGLAMVPNLYFATDVMRDLKAGVGISVPFGLKTEYASDWMGRFQAIKSDISTFNVNPSLSYKVSDTISVGGGINYQQLDAELTKAVNYVAVAFAAGGAPSHRQFRQPTPKEPWRSRERTALGVSTSERCSS